MDQTRSPTRRPLEATHETIASVGMRLGKNGLPSDEAGPNRGSFYIGDDDERVGVVVQIADTAGLLPRHKPLGNVLLSRWADEQVILFRLDASGWNQQLPVFDPLIATTTAIVSLQSEVLEVTSLGVYRDAFDDAEFRTLGGHHFIPTEGGCEDHTHPFVADALICKITETTTSATSPTVVPELAGPTGRRPIHA